MRGRGVRLTMTIKLNQLVVCEPAAPKSLQHFVEFWAKRYYYPDEYLYTQNITSNGKYTPTALRELFKWKIGSRLFGHDLPQLEKCFIGRRAQAAKLLKELDNCEPRHVAEGFLGHFGQGGAIYRIFWLHCWNPWFPIYDQHVHRAMTFIKEKQKEEIAPSSHATRIRRYLDEYLPFFNEFRGIDGREVDKALWRFGKSIKDRSVFPPPEK
jgi:hypothetical protein